MDSDIVIVGGGPAGLSLAASLSGNGLAITIVERLSSDQLADPPFDGREIALTHRSAHILDELSVWNGFSAEEVAPLREAQVLNGPSPFVLAFEPPGHIEGLLGWLVPNQCIRRELYKAAAACPDVRILAGTAVVAVRPGPKRVEITLGDGRALRPRLVVAADSRLSSVRDMLGIGARMHRTGRSMLVCRMEHEQEHRRVATEWFDHHQTLALLPLNGRISSAVVTLPSKEVERLAGLDAQAFDAEVSRRFAFRLGRMRLVSTRHVYPLTVTWSRRFVAERAALIGDAAVGMHPVTAHGFNLGLLGQHGLARELLRAVGRGVDPGRGSVLARYELLHRLACRPIYDATNAIVGLYTREGVASRLARAALLRSAHRLPLVRRGVGALLAHR
ncbi:MAG: 5-demethoxyubiquinol-8 5-hydroxylase UbiM [Sphingomonas sp.]|uniref:5-demethoxyubiquinol-8 5-hydroxylase UbiM n=1 Tax=Sphingomonas sp. TaxID=28214 RepID=UPI002272F201|nr:5-demethoxyubiquinol-8 5-hydroxylase UbiM [Sphingomonas sp.]MCX8474794.1 5-demethoxyubiquinol-8 5-hydroxylase UbiM [Sphingomonas sp.]